MENAQREFQDWLVNDYRMHVEEFEMLDAQEKREIIEEYTYFYN